MALTALYRQGQVYVRRLVHDMLGGQEQGGISTPRAAPVILLFSTEQGADYGYQDGWKPDGLYHYTGEGQSGDMQMLRGNRAIRDHQKHGKVLMLFEGVGPGAYRFSGFMNCVDHYEKHTDSRGVERRTIVFRLMPVSSINTNELLEQTEVATTFRDLRPSVLSMVGSSVARTRNPLFSVSDAPPDLNYEDDSRAAYEQGVRILQKYVLERAHGFCELCGHPAPFTGANGSPYLEVHYINSPGDYGLGEPRNLIALCPACHREAHYGKHSTDMAERLCKTAANVENSLDRGVLKTVTAAIIRDDKGKVLAAQRARGEFAGGWEFPGGQVKQGETLKECLVREISEELSLEVQGLTPYMKVDYDYTTFFIQLCSFTCRAEGAVSLHDHFRVAWMKPADLACLEWVPADRRIVRALCSEC